MENFIDRLIPERLTISLFNDCYCPWWGTEGEEDGYYQTKMLSTVFSMANIEKQKERTQYLISDLTVSRHTGETSLEIYCLYNIALSYIRVNEPRIALDYASQILTILEVEKPDYILKSTVLNLIGIAYAELGEINISQRFFQQAIAILTNSSKRTKEQSKRYSMVIATAKSNLAINGPWYWSRKQICSFKELIQARHHFKKANHAIGCAVVMVNLASRYYQRLSINLDKTAKKHSDKIVEQIEKDKRKIVELLNEAIRVADSNGYKVIEAAALTLLGKFNLLIGDRHIALDNYQAALSILNGEDDYLIKVQCLKELGYAKAVLGKYDEATDCYQQVLALHDLFNNEGKASLIKLDIAIVEYLKGNNDEAIKKAEEVLVLLNELSIPWDYYSYEVESLVKSWRNSSLPQAIAYAV